MQRTSGVLALVLPPSRKLLKSGTEAGVDDTSSEESSEFSPLVSDAVFPSDRVAASACVSTEPTLCKGNYYQLKVLFPAPIRGIKT